MAGPVFHVTTLNRQSQSPNALKTTIPHAIARQLRLRAGGSAGWTPVTRGKGRYLLVRKAGSGPSRYLTRLHRESSKSETSIKTTIPYGIVEEWGLSRGDYIRWEAGRGGRNAVVRLV